MVLELKSRYEWNCDSILTIEKHNQFDLAIKSMNMFLAGSMWLDVAG